MNSVEQILSSAITELEQANREKEEAERLHDEINHTLMLLTTSNQLLHNAIQIKKSRLSNLVDDLKKHQSSPSCREDSNDEKAKIESSSIRFTSTSINTNGGQGVPLVAAPAEASTLTSQVQQSEV